MATVIRGDDNFDTAHSASLAIIADVKGTSEDGGTFTSAAWRTRDLNTEVFDPNNIVTLSSNQFTLQSGTYSIDWAAPAHKVDRHQSRLYNITTSTLVSLGLSAYADDALSMSNTSRGISAVTISVATTFEIQHYCDVTKTTSGFGVDTISSGSGATNSVYTQVKIQKIGA